MKMNAYFRGRTGLMLFFGTLALLALAMPLQAQQYSVTWYKVSGGGGSSSNTPYAVSGTIGQHDASGQMSGGSYAVTGGFWALYAVQTPGAPVLTITYATSNQVIVSWPPLLTGWTLQTNNNITTTNWSNWSGTVVNNTVTNHFNLTGSLYFRLVNP